MRWGRDEASREECSEKNMRKKGGGRLSSEGHWWKGLDRREREKKRTEHNCGWVEIIDKFDMKDGWGILKWRMESG